MGTQNKLLWLIWAFDNALIGKRRLVADIRAPRTDFPAKHKCNLRVQVRGKYHRVVCTSWRLLVVFARGCFDK